MTTVDNSSNFQPLHANWYDRWHQAKDYQAEVDQISRVLAAEGGGPLSIVDIGCGTGQHGALLARAGHDVTGVDRSPVMVELARKRLAEFGSRARVVESDVAELHLDRTFDAATMMFSVLGYRQPDDQLFGTLAVAHRHLRPGGLLVFDVLDGTVVLRDGVLGGFSVVEDGDAQLLRETHGRIHHAEQVYESVMRIWTFDGSHLVATWQESHPIRYFLPREVELILDMAGFTLLGSEPLAGPGLGPTVEWARLFWARKK